MDQWTTDLQTKQDMASKKKKKIHSDKTNSFPRKCLTKAEVLNSLNASILHSMQNANRKYILNMV